MRKTELIRIIDHTNLKPDAKDNDIRRLCEEATEFRFKAAVVNPTNVKLAASLLHGSGVAVCSVVGFPLGANTALVKAFEAEQALRNGASEIDMVANIGALKSGRLDDVRLDIESVAAVVKKKDNILKVIIEAPLLTDDEKVKICSLAKEIEVDFVKSCTGFGGSAQIEDIQLMRKVVGDAIGVKAAGGIRSYSDAVAMVRAGASRIGTSSGTRIIEEAPE
jgi:deoxyribose-phosphate aldolase